MVGQTEPYTLLLVEDEADTRESLRLLLQEDGFHVLCASSAPEALSIVRERPPDLIIADVMMPGMTGFELCAYVRERPATSRVPIIVVSGHDYPAHSNTGLYDLALVKPVDYEHLARAIRTLLP